MKISRFREEARDCGLAATGRAPENQRTELADRQHAPDRCFGTEKMILAENIGERLGPQALG